MKREKDICFLFGKLYGRLVWISFKNKIKGVNSK